MATPLVRWTIKQFQKLSLLPEYFRAIAKEWLNIIFGETLVGIAFLLWWALANPPNSRLILVFVAAMFTAGYYAWRADYVRLIPKFEIRQVYRQGTPMVNSATGQLTGSSVYIQLVPKCLTDAEVEDCRGHLLRVSKFSKAGVWEETELNEPLLMEWSHGDENHSAVTLYPGIDRRLNVFFIHSSNWRITPCVYPFPLRATETFLPRDGEINAFRFEIRVTAKNSPPVALYLKAQTGSDPSNPQIDLTQAEDEGNE